MAIATFNTENDGLQPSQKERGHYIVDVNLEDSGPWIPYAEGVWVQLCRFNVTTGGFTVVLKGLPGAKLGVHYHTAPFMVLRCAVTGGIWSMTGLQSLVPLFSSRLAKLTRLLSPTIRQNQRSSSLSLRAH